MSSSELSSASFFLMFFLVEESPEATFRFLGGFVSTPLPLASIAVVLLDDFSPPVMPFLPLIMLAVNEDADVEEDKPLEAETAATFAIDSFSDRCDWIISFRRFRASAGSFDMGVMLSISLSCLVPTVQLNRIKFKFK